jgi:hypothetical protein
VFLALLGIIMAFISFLMDRGISICNQGTVRLFACVHFTAHNDVHLSNFVVTLPCAQTIHISVTFLWPHAYAQSSVIWDITPCILSEVNLRNMSPPSSWLLPAAY